MHTIKWFQFLKFLVQPSLSQEGQNVIHFDVLEQVTQTIHLKKSLSDKSQISTSDENVFNGARLVGCFVLQHINSFHVI